MLDVALVVITLVGVFLISFMKGAFGGGFAIIGIPLLSLVMDPLTAGALLAPLFIAMDVCALIYWKPSTWSRPDLLLLVPGLLVGIVLGYLALRVLDTRAVSIVIGIITLGFAALWFLGGRAIEAHPKSLPRALAAGMGSGVTTMIAHSGGPPLAMYLLSRGLPKVVYAGTTSLFFTVANAVKVIPWMLLPRPAGSLLPLMMWSLPAIPLGVWAGWKLHQRLDQAQLVLMCYCLLVIAAIKLLWDGIEGYL